jgi:Zn-dependent protease with chaperone function
MYTHLITFLAVILLFELYSPSPQGGKVVWWEVLVSSGAMVVLFHFLVRGGFARWERRGRARQLHEGAFPHFHAALLQRYTVAAVAVYALILYLFHWKELCVLLLGRERHQFLGSLLGILPFLFLLISAWTASYPSMARRLGSATRLAGYLISHAKLYLPVLLPWLSILLLMDLLSLLSPGLAQRIEEDALWSLAAFAAILLFLAALFPVLVVKLWRCPPLPHGPRRERLEAFFQRHGFRYAGMVLWTLFQGAVSTAGILGVFPRLRYILVTPSLLHSLSDDELEAVMAHEMGHARHRHMLFYLILMVGLTLLIDLVLRGAPWILLLGALALEAAGIPALSQLGRLETDPTAVSVLFTLIFLVAVLIYLRYGFGVFSRNFERQSDLHALELQGTSEFIVGSLEKVSGFHPLVRVLPSWHHFSIQERIDFLMACEGRPNLVRRHHHKVRLLVSGYLVGLMALGGAAVGWRTQHWDRAWAPKVQQWVAQRLLGEDPSNPALWFTLGSIAQERGDLSSAEEALRQTLRLAPEHSEALNNLAWLYATAPQGEFRRPEEALRLAEKAAQLRPDSPHILDTLAEARFINGLAHGAVEAAQRALALAVERQEYYRGQLARFRKALPTSRGRDKIPPGPGVAAGSTR